MKISVKGLQESIDKSDKNILTDNPPTSKNFKQGAKKYNVSKCTETTLKKSQKRPIFGTVPFLKWAFSTAPMGISVCLDVLLRRGS